MVEPASSVSLAKSPPDSPRDPAVEDSNRSMEVKEGSPRDTTLEHEESLEKVHLVSSPAL